MANDGGNTKMGGSPRKPKSSTPKAKKSSTNKKTPTRQTY